MRFTNLSSSSGQGVSFVYLNNTAEDDYFVYYVNLCDLHILIDCIYWLVNRVILIWTEKKWKF